MTTQEALDQINSLGGQVEKDEDAHIWIKIWGTSDGKIRRFDLRVKEGADPAKLIKIQEIMCEWQCSIVKEAKKNED